MLVLRILFYCVINDELFLVDGNKDWNKDGC